MNLNINSIQSMKKMIKNGCHLTTALENYTLLMYNLCLIHRAKSYFVRRASWRHSQAPSASALLIRLLFRYNNLNRKSIVINCAQNKETRLHMNISIALSLLFYGTYSSRRLQTFGPVKVVSSVNDSLDTPLYLANGSATNK